MIYDVIIIGAGASGLLCASKIKGQVLVLDSNQTAGAKVLVSGGGKCNFSNKNISVDNYYSISGMEKIKGILSNWELKDVFTLLKKYKIDYFDKGDGKLFAKDSKLILSALLSECKFNNVKFNFGVNILDIKKSENLWIVEVEKQKLHAKNIVIATGGKSYARLGASDFGLKIAKKFGLKLVQNQPALAGLKYPNELRFLSNLSGVSLPVKIKIKDKIFDDNLLFAHYGITGPAVLNTSLYVDVGDVVVINFIPQNSFRTIPYRVQKTFMDYFSCSDKKKLISKLKNFYFDYVSTFGYEKAEVMRGGVSLAFVNDNLESIKDKGLFFIGEVLDATGQLGGYNLHFAFASANLCAKALNHSIYR